jgi:hypothetical protein
LVLKGGPKLKILLEDRIGESFFINQVQNCCTLEVNVLLRINFSIMTYIKYCKLTWRAINNNRNRKHALLNYGGCEIRIHFSVLRGYLQSLKGQNTSDVKFLIS